MRERSDILSLWIVGIIGMLLFPPLALTALSGNSHTARIVAAAIPILFVPSVIISICCLPLKKRLARKFGGNLLNRLFAARICGIVAGCMIVYFWVFPFATDVVDFYLHGSPSHFVKSRVVENKTPLNDYGRFSASGWIFRQDIRTDEPQQNLAALYPIYGGILKAGRAYKFLILPRSHLILDYQEVD